MNITNKKLAGILPIICCVAAGAAAADLRIGLVGLDTSHSVDFAKLLNDPANPEHVPGGKIVVAWKGGSPDIEVSANRVEGFTQEMTKTYGVKIYDSIEDVARNSDAVIIMSVDGRRHLNEARRVFPFRKPVFVDKPMAGSLEDAIEIFRLARQYNVPCFSSSSLRYSEEVVALKQAQIGRLHGVFSYGPGPIEPHVADLLFSGIHVIEKCYTLMGTGCISVVRTHTANTDTVTGIWSDGRVATVRTFGYKVVNTFVNAPTPAPGTKPTAGNEYGMIEFGSEAIMATPPALRGGYQPLLKQVMKFFQTGISPVPHAETIEILTFIEAADVSKRRGGVPVSLHEVLMANGGSDGI